MTFQQNFNEPKERSFEAEDISFVTGDSPATHDINDDLQRNSIDGHVINDGPGDILMTWSPDGTNFSGNIRIKNLEIFDLSGLSIDTIKMAWVTNSAYRIFAR
jgi:hypothetical protein